MTPYRIVACVAGALALAYVGLTVHGCAKQAQAQKQSINAAVATGEAQTHAQQAQSLDAQAEAQAKAIQDQDQIISDLRAKLAAKSKPSPAPSAVPDVPAVPVVDDADSLKDQLIEAQDKQITSLKGEVMTLTTQRDHYRAAFEAENTARVATEMSLSASLALAKTERWKGRLEGLAVGLGAGYIGGRIF